MDNLRFLNISHNQLSDREFRTILSRYRVFRTGFRVLESLDVSGNAVSLKTLKCVLRFPQLRTLRVSIASSLVQRDSEFLKHWRECVSACGFHEDKYACTHQLSHIGTEGFGVVIVHEWEKMVIEFEMKRKKKFERRRNNSSSGNFYSFQPAAWTSLSSLSEREKRNKMVNTKPDEDMINDLENYDTHTYKKIDKVNCEEEGENINNKEWDFAQEKNVNKRRDAEQNTMNSKRPKIVCNMNRTRPMNIEEHRLKEEQEEMKLNEELALFKKFYLNKN